MKYCKPPLDLDNQTFDSWNKIKKSTNIKKNRVYFKQRDIFYMKVGQNIGFEQSGKGDKFLRPVIVFKKFNNNFFVGIPLTTTIKNNRYYFNFSFTKNRQSSAILSQIRAFDSKRIQHKIGVINQKDFKNLQIKVQELYTDMLASPDSEDDPEGICKNIISKKRLNIKDKDEK